MLKDSLVFLVLSPDDMGYCPLVVRRALARRSLGDDFKEERILEALEVNTWRM